MSYRDADLAHGTGHRQVADAYLAARAARHHGLLATFDEELASAVPKHVVLTHLSQQHALSLDDKRSNRVSTPRQDRRFALQGLKWLAREGAFGEVCPGDCRRSPGQ